MLLLCVCLGNKAVLITLGNPALLLQHRQTLQGVSAEQSIELCLAI